MSETPRNQRNVEAIVKVCEGLPAYYGGDVRELAEFLASRGVLGPASEVLTSEDADRTVKHFSSYEEVDWLADAIGRMPTLAFDLERIAKGED